VDSAEHGDGVGQGVPGTGDAGDTGRAESGTVVGSHGEAGAVGDAPGVGDGGDDTDAIDRDKRVDPREESAR
jgi:hypothetical protein